MAEKKKIKQKNIVQKTSVKKTANKEETIIDKDLAEKMMKAKEDAMKKFNSVAMGNSKEIEESREKGKQVGAIYKELEECNKIEEEFKTNPPLMTSVHINGKLISQVYDKGVIDKIAMLKKHSISFTPAVHHQSTFGIEFKVFGRAYVKRSGQKIPLEESFTENTFVLKDGDIIGTENSSYVFDLKEYNETDKKSTSIIIYPKSEMRFSLNETVTNPAPAFMDPSKVSNAIKSKSKSTVISQKLTQVEPLQGLFFISIKREGNDVTKMLKFGASYPKIKFKSASAIYAGVVGDLMEKMKAQNPKLAQIYEAKTNMSSNIKGAANRTCDEITGFFELSGDGSIVITRSGNLIVHESIGKETRKVPTNALKPIKATFTHDALYETDTGKNPDNRVAKMVEQAASLSIYAGAINMKKSIEERGKIMGKASSTKDASVQKETEGMLRYAQESGDKELIEAAQAQMKSMQSYLNSGGSAAEENGILKSIAEYEKQISAVKPKLLSSLSPYSSPSGSDKA